MMKAYDVAVLGLGAMGSSAVCELSARGVEVIGVERFTPGHSHGSSHGDSRIIRQAYFEDPSYVPLIDEAYQLWADLEERTGTRLLTITGGLLLGATSSQTISGSRQSAEHWDLEHEILTAQEIRTRYPVFTPPDQAVGVYEKRAGFLRPEDAVKAQLKVAHRNGARLMYNTTVLSWKETDSGVQMYTTDGILGARHLILSAGPWSPRVLGMNINLSVERQVMHWFKVRGPLDRFSPSNFPVFIWEMDGGDQIYGFPARDTERDVKVAFFRRRNPTNPDQLDCATHAQEVEEMRATLESRIPSLVEHSRAVACMYTVTPDHHFIVGRHPYREHVSVAAGFSGHGFKFSPVVGKILADLATEGVTERDISLFDPSRRELIQPEV